MASPLSRRRLLAVGGTGTTLAVTGRLAAEDDENDDSETDTDTGSDDDTDDGDADEPESDGEETVAVAANVDQAAFEALREEITERVEEGDIDQVEAQAELQEGQRELIADAVEALEARADETEGLTVTETEPAVGLSLVDGDPSSLIAALEFEEVAALIPAARFEEARDGQ